MTEVAIIGYGRFGKLAAHYLRNYVRVVVSDRNKISKLEKGISQVPLRDAAKHKVVILAVPINQLPSVLHSITPFLHPTALICDVCSVKELPLAWMKHILPKHVSILGTHPLFGPDSAQKTYQGKSIVLCPARISKANVRTITHVLRKSGLNVVQMTPQRHDRLMADTLFLTQFIGRGLSQLHLPSVKTTTENYTFLKHIIETSMKDSQELFRDMYRYNRYAHHAARNVIQTFKRLQSELTR